MLIKKNNTLQKNFRKVIKKNKQTNKCNERYFEQ